jgi:hypothetical protein
VRTRKTTNKSASPLVAQKLASHFGKQPLAQLVTASRKFPIASRIDLQAALDEMFQNRFHAELIGLHRRFGHDTITVSELLTTDNSQ